MEAYINNSFCKRTAKNSDNLAYVANNIFINFPIIISRSYFFIEQEVKQKNQVK